MFVAEPVIVQCRSEPSGAKFGLLGAGAGQLECQERLDTAGGEADVGWAAQCLGRVMGCEVAL